MNSTRTYPSPLSSLKSSICFTNVVDGSISRESLSGTPATAAVATVATTAEVLDNEIGVLDNEARHLKLGELLERCSLYQTDSGHK
jgi:hypothetical protein